MRAVKLTGTKQKREGQRSERGRSQNKQELVIIRVPIGGTVWAVEANNKHVTNVQAGAFIPQPGEVYEAIHKGSFWRLSQRIQVKSIPDEIRHPDFSELVASARDLADENVLRIGNEIVVSDEIDPASLVTHWSFSTLEAEAAYCASLVNNHHSYPELQIQLHSQTIKRLSMFFAQSTEALISAARRYDLAKNGWDTTLKVARDEWIKNIDDATSEVREIYLGKEELERDFLRLEEHHSELTTVIGEARDFRDVLRKEIGELDVQVRDARRRLQAEEKADQDPRSTLRARRRFEDEAEALAFAMKRLADRFENAIPLVRLHVALKHAPFTVLTGPSGAGKTSLVHQYARALGIHVTTVAVQPNWTSVQDLHGYVDPIGGRHYRGTPFSAALRAQTNYAAVADHEAPLDLVLLDEINLAFVEYFLSDYLSAFETADRQVQLATRDEVDGLPEEPFAWLRRGHGQVQVPRSFLIAGTANEDHTTRAFSDKFRDRSAFLHLPPPTIAQALQAPEQPVDSDYYVTRAAWEAWQMGSAPDDAQRDGIRRLAEGVAATGLPFSVRVFQRALLQYADAQRLLEALGMKNAAAHAYDLAVSLSVAPKYAPLLLGREKDDARRALQGALTSEGTGQLTREVLAGVWPTARA